MPEKAEKIKRISLAEIQGHMKEFAFVDARSPTALSRNPSQVPGAVHFAAKDMARPPRDLSRNRPIVTYCT